MTTQRSGLWMLALAGIAFAVGAVALTPARARKTYTPEDAQTADSSFDGDGESNGASAAAAGPFTPAGGDARRVYATDPSGTLYATYAAPSRDYGYAEQELVAAAKGRRLGADGADGGDGMPDLTTMSPQTPWEEQRFQQWRLQPLEVRQAQVRAFSARYGAKHLPAVFTAEELGYPDADDTLSEDEAFWEQWHSLTPEEQLAWLLRWMEYLDLDELPLPDNWEEWFPDGVLTPEGLEAWLAWWKSLTPEARARRLSAWLEQAGVLISQALEEAFREEPADDDEMAETEEEAATDEESAETTRNRRVGKLRLGQLWRLEVETDDSAETYLEEEEFPEIEGLDSEEDGARGRDDEGEESASEAAEADAVRTGETFTPSELSDMAERVSLLAEAMWIQPAETVEHPFGDDEETIMRLSYLYPRCTCRCTHQTFIYCDNCGNQSLCDYCSSQNNGHGGQIIPPIGDLTTPCNICGQMPPCDHSGHDNDGENGNDGWDDSSWDDESSCNDEGGDGGNNGGSDTSGEIFDDEGSGDGDGDPTCNDCTCGVCCDCTSHNYTTAGSGTVNASASVSFTSPSSSDPSPVKIKVGNYVTFVAAGSFTYTMSPGTNWTHIETLEDSREYIWSNVGSPGNVSEVTHRFTSSGNKTVSVAYKGVVKRKYRFVPTCTKCGNTKTAQTKTMTASATSPRASISVRVYSMNLQAKGMLTGNSAIAAGGLGSYIHLAEVRAKLTPQGDAGDSFPFNIEITGDWAGAEGTGGSIGVGDPCSPEWRMYINGSKVTGTLWATSDGHIYLLSSANKVGDISIASTDEYVNASAGVTFEWAENIAWEFEPTFVPEEYEPVSLTDITLQGHALENHTLWVYALQVELDSLFFDPYDGELYWEEETINRREDDPLTRYTHFSGTSSAPSPMGEGIGQATVNEDGAVTVYQWVEDVAWATDEEWENHLLIGSIVNQVQFKAADMHVFE